MKLRSLTRIPGAAGKIHQKLIGYLILQSKRFRSTGDFSKAGGILKILRLLFPRRLDVLAESAAFYSDTRDYTSAVEYARKAAGSKPDNDPSPGLLDRIAIQATKYAIDTWDLASALEFSASIPGRDDRHLRRAEIHFYLGDIDKARESLLQASPARKLSPAESAITEAILGKDEYGKLRSEFIEDTSNIDSATHTYINLILESGEESKASRLIELHSGNATAGTVNALAHLKATHLLTGGRYREASRELDALMRQSPATPAIQNSQILSLLNQDKRAEAVALFESRPKKRKIFTPLDFYIAFCKGGLREAYDLYKYTKPALGLKEGFGNGYFDDIQSINRAGESAFIFVDGGVGDEIRHSKLYRILEKTGARICIACDPRLETILRRTYPGLAFIPVKRVLQTKARFNLYESHDKVRKSMHLAFICDNTAWEAAAAFPRAGLLSALISSAIPQGRDFTEIDYSLLKPAPHLIEKYRQLLAPMKEDLLVGFAWRSTHLSTARSVHYTEITGWREMFKTPGIKVVNLQPKITDSEISALREAGADLVELPELDLFDDFESMVAVLSLLDVVIAPCNATLELAGAVGTPAFFTSPTFQTTLRKRADGRDIWHANVEIIAPAQFGDKQDMIDRVCARLRDKRNSK